MATEPPAVEPPRHPLPALTTYELARYRRELDHALRVLPPRAPVRALLRQRLAEAAAEQESRAAIRSTPR
jgi:hypothetical protein